MDKILDFLSNTPFYVYLIFIYLLIIGIRSSKDRVISINKILLINCLFVYLSLNGIIKLQLSFANIIYFLLIGLASSFLGWFQLANQQIMFDKQKRLIALPGSWTTLALLLFIFGYKYYLGYQNFQDSGFLPSLKARYLIICATGFSFGLIIGRLINYAYRLKFGKHTEIETASKVIPPT